MTERRLPPNASMVQPVEGSKLCAPSAERNCQVLCDLLAQVAPKSGKALELASGTGQHAVAFANRLDNLNWQPSEPNEARRASINAYVVEADLRNLESAIELDVTKPGWGASVSGHSLIVVINLTHLITMPEVVTMLNEAAHALDGGGRFVIYGPFMRAGELTSEGDAAFHSSLTAQDPQIGYKDDFDMLDAAQAAGFGIAEVVEMPANNLALVLEKPAI